MPFSELTTWFWVLALLGSGVFILRVAMMLTGLAAEGVDADLGMDGDLGDMGDIGDAGGADAIADVPDGMGDAHRSTHAFQIFSIQTVSAFTMGTGWMGLAAHHGELGFQPQPFLSILLAVAFGVFVAWLQLWLLRKSRLLESRGARINPRDAIGKAGQVYMRIPEENTGQGKVRVNISGSLRIMPAVTDGSAIESFTSISVKSARSDGVLIVAPTDV
ncbi:MAG: hypothetical protein KAS72_01800 [Phycisphaerales bacterium]|nr:hypothetical protein [Phycisphaerales bacterium]